MVERDPILSVRLSPAQERELDKIAEETGRSKAELVRESITVLIGMYKNARAESAGKKTVL